MRDRSWFVFALIILLPLCLVVMTIGAIWGWWGWRFPATIWAIIAVIMVATPR